MRGIVYHEIFNKYDLGADHPLIGERPRLAMELFKERGILREFSVMPPLPAEEEHLLLVHGREYVDRVKKLSVTGGMLAIDTPAPPGIYDYARWAVGGSMYAGRKLFEGYDLMLNPLGGFHHASRNSSSGFCFFNDIAVTIEYLRNLYDLNRIVIIDLDVHHANGTEEIYSSDPGVLNLSFHQDGRTLYPGTGDLEFIGVGEGMGYTVNLPLPPGTGGEAYLYAVKEIIPPLVREFKPQLIIYQAGVDTHHLDPLADLKLSYQTYYSLGRIIGDVSSTCNKLLVLFGGGYNSTASVKSSYNIVCGLMGYNDYFTEEDRFSMVNIDTVKSLVSRLKEILSSYWTL